MAGLGWLPGLPVLAAASVLGLTLFASNCYCAVYLEDSLQTEAYTWTKSFSGDAFYFAPLDRTLTEQEGGVGKYYVYKRVPISEARGLHVELEYRGESSARYDPYEYIRGMLEIVDPESPRHLLSIPLCEGKVGDTAWTFGRFDISGFAGGLDRVEIRLVVNDEWPENRGQVFSFRDLRVWGMPHVDRVPDFQVPCGGRSRTIDLDDFLTETDYPKDDVQWEVSGGTWVRAVLDSTSHELYFRADSSWTGEDTFTVTARSPDGLTGSQDIMVTAIQSPLDPVLHLSTDHLSEDFGAADLWEDHTLPGHRLDTYEGNAHIKEYEGQGGPAYIGTIVNIHDSQYLHIEFDYRAKSDNPSHTSAWMELLDPHRRIRLTRVDLILPNNPSDTGWVHFGPRDITPFVGDLCTIEIRLGLDDHWIQDHQQEVWFDNLRIWSLPHISGLPDPAFDRDQTSKLICLTDYLTSDGDVTWNLYGNVNTGMKIENSMASFFSEGGWYGTETVAVSATTGDGLIAFEEVEVMARPIMVPVTIGTKPEVTTITVYDDLIEDKLEPKEQPHRYMWREGRNYMVILSSREAGNRTVKYIFTCWNDGDTGMSRNVRAEEGLELYAQFKTQYFLEAFTEPGADTLPAQGWYDANRLVEIQAPSPGGYSFSHWILDGQKISIRELRLNMSRPHVLVAHYVQEVFQLTLYANVAACDFTLDEERIAANPTATLSLHRGKHGLSLSEPTVIRESTMYNFTLWSDGITSPDRVIDIDRDCELCALFDVLHELSLLSSGASIDIPGSGWYLEGTQLTLHAPASGSHVFDRWVVNGIVVRNSDASMAIDGPVIAVAHYLSRTPLISAPGQTRREEYYTLAWTSVPRAQFYEVLEDVYPDFSTPRIVYNGSDTSVSLVHTEPGTFYYRARAGTTAGWSDWGNTTLVEVTRAPLIPVSSNPILSMVPVLAGLAILAGAAFAWRRHTRKPKQKPTIDLAYSGKEGVWRSESRVMSLPWARIGIVLAALVGGLLLAYSVQGFLNGWHEIEVSKDGMETVELTAFGEFALTAESLPSIGCYARVCSKAHGMREFGPGERACYDGIVKGKVLVFRWKDSDVDSIFIEHRIMSDKEYRQTQP